MELRHLRYFVAVANSESVRIASTRVHISQPAISRQIHQLEEEVGARLFDRLPRGLVLTPAGRALLAEAHKALALIDSGVRVARLISDGMRGLLRLGFVENAGWDGFVPSAFGLLQKDAPDIALELVPLSTPEQLIELADERLDGGFVYMFSELPEGFASVPLLDYNVVLAIPVTWEIENPEPVLLGLLTQRPFVAFRRAVYPAYYDRLIAACSTAGVTLRIVQEVSSEAAVLSLVSAGVGAAVVNSANRGRPPARVRFLDLKDLSVPLPLSFVYKRSNDNPALKRMLDALQTTIHRSIDF